MKIIDLLNKIAKGEEVPKKLKIKKWEYNSEDENLEYELFDRLYEVDFKLNDEVEILEEKKIPEKLSYFKNEEQLYNMSKILLFNNIVDKINEIIDCLGSKGE